MIYACEIVQRLWHEYLTSTACIDDLCTHVHPAFHASLILQMKMWQILCFPSQKGCKLDLYKPVLKCDLSQAGCMKMHEAKWSNSSCCAFLNLCTLVLLSWRLLRSAETNLPLTPRWDCSHWGHHWRRSQTFLPVGDSDTSGSKALQFWWKTDFDIFWLVPTECLLTTLLLLALIRAPPKCHAESEMWLDGRSWSGTCRSPQWHSCIAMLILQHSLALQKHPGGLFSARVGAWFY